MENKVNNFIFRIGYIVAIITFVSLYLLFQSTQGSEKLEDVYGYLAITTIIGIILLLIIVIYYSIKLVSSYIKKVPGSSLSINILVRTIVLALIPILFISFFSFKFLRYEYQSSFDIGIDKALNSSLKLSRKALDIRSLQALKNTNNIAKRISFFNYNYLQSKLENIRKDNDIYELTVFDEKGFIQSFASENKNILLPIIPEHSDFSRVENKEGLFDLETINGEYQIRVLTTINKPAAANYYLQSIYKIPDTVSELAKQVSITISERDKFNYLKPKISNSFIIVLFLVIILALLLLLLSSIGFANYMSEPISYLIKGTKKVSTGDFSKPLSIKRKDDFGTLFNSFNTMTKSLGIATKEAEQHRIEVDNERAYLAAIIEHITSAVITLDNKGRLLTFNDYAENLLNNNLLEIVYLDNAKIGFEFESYKNFIHQLNINYNYEQNFEKEIEIQINDASKKLIARLTSLPSTDINHGGYVVIFDDLTKYWEQQKAAAWEEVARRLAHEIKNPLTPIQLAAERISYKLSKSLPEKDKEILNRSINVITKQVESMKNMVNDFSDYAKPIVSKKEELNMHYLINDIFYLYAEHYDRVSFHKQLTAKNDLISGNSNVLRQVIHNVIKNSIESTESKDESYKGLVNIKTSNELNYLIIEIIDNGLGLKNSNENLFDPYITSKEKGTGLGLAIVKKIINEHQGNVYLNNNLSKGNGDKITGATMRIELPILNKEKKINENNKENINEPETN